MRHAKHRHQLGRKKEHREALMANLAVALITNKRIKTTLAKAKALRPYIEKIITLAKKAYATDDKLRKHHCRRLALSKVRDINAVNRLFNDLVEEFVKREGGYTRIYKLIPRIGDAADMALIEFIDGDDEGYSKKKSKASTKTSKDAKDAVVEESDTIVSEEVALTEAQTNLEENLPEEEIPSVEETDQPKAVVEESSEASDSVEESPVEESQQEAKAEITDSTEPTSEADDKKDEK
jgi:large subunit ribosomal protein L17